MSGSSEYLDNRLRAVRCATAVGLHDVNCYTRIFDNDTNWGTPAHSLLRCRIEARNWKSTDCCYGYEVNHDSRQNDNHRCEVTKKEGALLECSRSKIAGGPIHCRFRTKRPMVTSHFAPHWRNKPQRDV